MLFSGGRPKLIGFYKEGLTFIFAEILQENEQSHIFEINKIRIFLATYFYINVTMMFL